MRGAGRDRHERAVGCGGRESLQETNASFADGEAVWSWRPDAGVKLAGSIPPMTVARKPGHRGEHGISRNPLRRESRIASAGPVCSCAFFLCIFAHETAGAARTRLSLRPLVLFRGWQSTQTSGTSCRENVKLCLNSSLRGALATKQSILFLRGEM